MTDLPQPFSRSDPMLIHRFGSHSEIVRLRGTRIAHGDSKAKTPALKPAGIKQRPHNSTHLCHHPPGDATFGLLRCGQGILALVSLCSLVLVLDSGAEPEMSLPMT